MRLAGALPLVFLATPLSGAVGNVPTHRLRDAVLLPHARLGPSILGFRRMHGNRRYVKLRWIGAAAIIVGLALPSLGRAEIVNQSANQPFLAVGSDGTPYVADTSLEDVFVATRRPAGWVFERLGRLPSRRAHIAGLVVGRRGAPTVLAQADDGAWIALGQRGRLRVIARAPTGASFGPAGLALDAAGRPAIAYALRLGSRQTFLRLVTTDSRRRLRTRAVTKRGFPSSDFAPGAAPVLVRGRLHVVETYTSAAIDWQPQKKGGWIGQYLFAGRVGTPAGRVGAVAAGDNLWSAWAQLYPETTSVLLTLSARTQETSVVLEHGIFRTLILVNGQPELGAYDWAEIGDWRTYAGVIADASGPIAELDGRLEGYAAAPGGRRQILLVTANGLEWFEAPSRTTVRVSLTVDPSGSLSGRVDGAQGGAVQIYREGPTGSPRALVGVVPLEADGSFAAQDPTPISPTLYRAVYVEATTGIPYASLLRTPVG
jgi:hypothetical protein